MEDCLFCKIAAGEIPSECVYQDEYCYAFKDINPLAPVHLVLIPREHIASLNEINASNVSLAAHCLEAIPKIAALFPELNDGYRIMSNCGANAGQSVFHLHFHILGGKRLKDDL